jgi:hypothetical protein
MFVSTVTRSEMGERFDPAYFSPLVLETEQWLEGFDRNELRKLHSIAEPIASAFYEGIADRYAADGVPLIRVNDVRNGALQLSEAAFLADDLARGTPGLRTIEHPAILVSKGGVPASVGRVAVTRDTRLYALSRDVIGLIPRDKEYTGYLLFFLASPPGRAQVMRGASRQCQAHLTLERLGAVSVPPVGESERTTMNEAAAAVVRTRVAFEEARRRVDHAIERIDPFSHPPARTLSFGHARTRDLRIRMDPRYYRPGPTGLQEEVKQAGWTPLSSTDWVEFASRTWDRKAADPGARLRYVALGSIEALSSRIVKPLEFRAWQTPSRAKWILDEGEVLEPYLLRSLKRVGVVDAEDATSLASSGFHPLRTGSEEDSLALAAYLSGRGAQAQIIRAGTGGVMQSVTKDLLGEVWLPPRDRLAGIADLMHVTQTAAQVAQESWEEGASALSDMIGWGGSTDLSSLGAEENLEKEGE